METDHAVAYNHCLGGTLTLSEAFCLNGDVWQLVLLLHDRQQFFFVDFQRTDWTKELLYYLGCMATAAYAGAMAIGVLSLNSRPVRPDNWRSRALWSAAALLVIDTMAIEYLVFSVRVLVTNSVA